MNKITVKIPATFLKDMTYYFTLNELIEFKNNVIKGQSTNTNAVIGKTYFRFGSEGILHFDNPTFEGNSYELFTEGLIERLDNYIEMNS